MTDKYAHWKEEPVAAKADPYADWKEEPAAGRKLYANTPPASPEFERHMAEGRKNMKPAKQPEDEEPSFFEGALRSWNQGSTKGGFEEGLGNLVEHAPGLTGAVQDASARLDAFKNGEPLDVALKREGRAGERLTPDQGKAMKMPDGSTRPVETPQDLDRAVRERERQLGKKFSDTHPWADFAISTAGDLTSDYALAGKKGLGPLWNAASGAATGFLGSGADTTAGETSAGDILEAGAMTTLGGLTAGLTPKALSWGAKKAGGAGRALKDFAEERAVKVLGRDLQGLLAGGKDAVHNLGRDLLDSKVVKMFDGVLPLGTTTDQAGDRLVDLAGERGNRLGGLIDTIDDAAQPGDKLRVDALTDRLRQRLLSSKAPAEADMRRVMKREIDEVAKLSSDPDTAALTVRQAEELLKRPAQGKVDYEKVIKGRNQKALANVANAQKEAIEAHVDNVVGARAPELSGEFQAAKKAYGLAKQGVDIAGKQEKRNLMNNMVTPTDYAAGMAAASNAADGAGGKVEAGLWALAHHLLKTRGNSVAAVTADKIGDLANKLRIIPGVVNKVGTPLAGPAIRYLLRDHPEVADKLLAEEAPPP